MKTYEYKQKISTALIGLAISATVAYGATRYALENENALVINQSIYLSAGWARVFIGFGALAGWLLFGFCVLLTFMALSTKREIKLLANRMEAPKGGFSAKKVVIPYESVKRVEMQISGEMKFLHVHHRSGRLTIIPAMLPKKSDLDEIYTFLLSRTVQVQSPK